MKKNRPAPPMDFITFGKGVKVIDMVKQYASSNIEVGETERECYMLHKSVCQQLLGFCETHNDMPFYAVLAMCVGADAYKDDVFKRGYSKFDGKRGEFAYEMGKWYNSYLGLKGKPSDVTYRLVRRFYDQVSTDKRMFKERVRNAYEMDGKRGRFKELCQSIGIH